MSGKKENAIEVVRLSKHYGSLKAVDSVSLSIKEGSVFGLLGPNGAGKTTLISMLVTMRKPTSGSARVNGFDIVREAGSVRKSIGIVFQDQSLDDEMTAMENLELHAALYGVPKKERTRRIEELLSMVGLSEKKRELVKRFSGGMKRRLEIARGLVHHPKILFLDEPTIGLDPQTRASIWKYIKNLNRKENITIILTTHYMDEADNACNEIAIIDRGKIIAMDKPKNLKNRLGGDIVSIKCKNQGACERELLKVKWAKSVLKDNGFVNIKVERGEEKIPMLLSLMERKGVRVESVSLRKPSLDDVFLHYTGRSIRQEEASAADAMKLRMKMRGRRP